MLAAGTYQEVAMGRPSCTTLAAWTHKTLRPTQLHQILSARLLTDKPSVKLRQIAGIIFVHQATGYPSRQLNTPLHGFQINPLPGFDFG
jgi:hypothetical protein